MPRNIVFKPRNKVIESFVREKMQKLLSLDEPPPVIFIQRDVCFSLETYVVSKPVLDKYALRTITINGEYCIDFRLLDDISLNIEPPLDKLIQCALQEYIDNETIPPVYKVIETQIDTSKVEMAGGPALKMTKFKIKVSFYKIQSDSISL